MATVIFDQSKTLSGNVGLDLWIDLGLIPTALVIWIGTVIFTAGAKAETFELRCNLTGQSAGTVAATKLLDTAALKASTSLTHDLYKKGTLHTVTTLGKGVEKWWLRVTSKSSTLAACSAKILYTTAAS